MMLVLGAFALSLSIGILTGMFGVGGGFLITPLLNVLLGIPMPLAVGTSTVQILGVSTAGLYRKHGEGRTDYKMALMLFGGNLVGVRLGAAALGRLTALGTLVLSGKTLAWVDLAVLCVFLVLLSFITIWLWYDASRRKPEQARHVGFFARITLPPYTAFDTLDHPRLSIIVMVLPGPGPGLLDRLTGHRGWRNPGAGACVPCRYAPALGIGDESGDGLVDVLSGRHHARQRRAHRPRPVHSHARRRLGGRADRGVSVQPVQCARFAALL